MTENGNIDLQSQDGIATITFSHPKSNALPGSILSKLAETITAAGNDPGNKVIVLKSAGEKAFCAGASFDELLAIDDREKGRLFFSGFAELKLQSNDIITLLVIRFYVKNSGTHVNVLRN